MSKAILKSTSQIGILALFSRFIAFFREYLLIRFLSIGDISDIFFTAFRIPNTMRKIFAEGVLSAILVPALVNARHKDGDAQADKLTTLSFFVIESLIFLFCLGVFFKAHGIIGFIAPGFAPQKAARAGDLLQILISFILFISSGAIFAAALQAHKKFFIPAIAPAILNVLYVSALVFCWLNNVPVELFCVSMIGVACIYFCIHLGSYFYMQYSLQMPDRVTWRNFSLVLLQLIPCIFSSGILEINHFINTMYGSYLPSGSLTLIRTSFQFINIPVGIIAASLSTVLLPHFSKLHLDKSESLSHHIFEAIKFTLWSTLPICFLLGFFSKEIFQTLFWADAQALAKVDLAQSVFVAYLIGLLAFSLNKIFLSVFFALRLSLVPMMATFIAIAINYSLTRLLLAQYQATGIALAASVSSIVQTMFFMIFLHRYLKIPFHKKEYVIFFRQYILQLLLYCAAFVGMVKCIRMALMKNCFSYTLCLIKKYTIVLDAHFFSYDIGMWIWAGPLALALLYALYSTRSKFKITLEYFDKI